MDDDLADATRRSVPLDDAHHDIDQDDVHDHEYEHEHNHKDHNNHLRASQLPSLPSDQDDDSLQRSNASFLDDKSNMDDASLLDDKDNMDNASFLDDEDDDRDEHFSPAFNERELRRHLMDVESSFLPDVAPPAPSDHHQSGADDTFANIGSPGDDALPVSRILGLPPRDESVGRTPGIALRGGRSRAGRETEGKGYYEEHEQAEDERVDEETEDDRIDGDAEDNSLSDIQPSSPAAAAATRTNTRSTSHPDLAQSYSTSRDPIFTSHSDLAESHHAPDRSTYEDEEQDFQSPSPQQVPLPPSEMGSSLLNSRQSARPTYSTSSSRFSKRSYAAESVLSPDEDASYTDFALMSGGATAEDPRSSMKIRQNSHRHPLSRLPSFGSIASGISGHSNDDKPGLSRGISSASGLAALRADRQLDRLDEEDSLSHLSDPMTPRAATFSTFSAPTDTVIAQHVQNIHVPDTVAREYHQRNYSASPSKSRPQSAGTNVTIPGRPPSSNLTLKEQNSKIDKLTKENFDLKLKIHFLDQALQNRSDEGVKDMINKNVQFQTDLANERKETQSLKRRIRELERKLKQQEEDLAEARATAESGASSSNEELEYEILQLSEEVDRCQIKITRLSADNMAKEAEKRKMAEHIAALNDRKGSQQSAAEEETEMWKDLLQTETDRREQAEDDARKLREEIALLRTEKAVETNSKSHGFNRLRRQKKFDSRSVSRDSRDDAEESAAPSSANLQIVQDQLRHENAELRRDLGAQTSMLTSRNKERERLQQEIEDLKLLHRKGEGSRALSGDSILDRSISRQHQRATSRASGQSITTPMSDTERDEWERREGALRDQNAALRMDYQDLDREFQARASYIEELEQAVENLETTYDSAITDLQALQKERDDALQAMDDREREADRLQLEYEKLKAEAVNAISELEGDLDSREEDIKRLASDLKDKDDDFNALQRELRDLNNSLVQLEDDRAAALKRIESLEQELDEATQELELQDKKLNEANQKIERLEVQQESLHAEISFLREEQEGDKIKIGDLENSLNAAQESVSDEREKMQELEESLIEERRQREIIDNRSKQEVQEVLNDLNVENSNVKDEVRRLRRVVSTKEVEVSSFKRSLEELETQLHRALGDNHGKRTHWFGEIERIQNNLESTMDALEKTKSNLAEKDRLLRNRDMLLESSGLESRRLNDLLEKEREARKRDLHQYEQSMRGHSGSNRQIAQHESRVLELETARSQDRREMAMLEQQYRDQLAERSNLLLALWNRLSALCGSEWARNNGTINGETPSVDLIARSLPSFNRNIIDAVRTIESLLGSFKQRIKSVEKNLQKDYQILSTNLDGRIKRMDFLERAVKDAQTQIDEQAREQAHLRLQQKDSRSINKNNEELVRLKNEVKTLRNEIKFYKQTSTTSEQQQQQQKSGGESSRPDSSASSSIMRTPRAIANTLMRHHSSTAIEQSSSAAANGANRHPIVIATPPIQPSEQRWIHRLKELEKRLKAEREARLLDRRGARLRLEERSAENEELKSMLEREKERRIGLGLGEDDSEDGGDGRGRSDRSRDNSID